MTTLPDKPLLRVDEVADHFGVSRSAIYLWIDHGKLIAGKYGGLIRIKKEEVEKFLELGIMKPLE
jgi:excisionase family DNA binding protein